MDISIVSGTYNRIELLKAMVQSVRKSLLGTYGISYEVVLVDGGSTDGTIEWCKKQPDIRLIEHGQLLGAVKAFNDASFAAQGTYVILANDDVEFLDDSILQAWIYMQAHPACGIGCFYQDRNGREWHVENMPVVLDGKQSNLPYGQVCMVPKWLGDHVGWWGTYLHTYGGDNELSAKVYELGFKVSPVPGAKIHDREANDDLRKKNNIDGGKDPRAVRG
ncbi:MAG: glycosyltransferase family 2 protein, partial [Nitrospiria bacterium]